MGRTIALFVNRHKPDACAAEGQVASLIEAHGTLAFSDDVSNADRLRAAGEIDLVVSLGGDGTILSLVDAASPLGLPLLGVNLGKLGFLAEYDLDGLSSHGERLFGAGELEIRELDRLQAQVFGRDEDQARFVGEALNDVVMTAGPPYRMISIGLRVDGENGPEVSGDGMIVSTPTGSTAYTLSAGGPILTPGVRGMVITPIAAHSLSFRPIVVDASSTVEMRLDRVNAEDGHGTTLLLDGRPEARLEEGERVVIGRGGSARFVTNPSRSYWETLVGKLRWAQAPVFRSVGGA